MKIKPLKNALSLVSVFMMFIGVSSLSFADYREHYKSDPNWEMVWQDWCEGLKGGVSGDELETVKHISTYIAFQHRSGDCSKEQEYLKYDMGYLKIRGRNISDYSPLIALLDAKNLKILNLRLTRPTQDELNKLGFLEDLPEFKQFFLPYSLNNDGPPKCPLTNKELCF